MPLIIVDEIDGSDYFFEPVRIDGYAVRIAAAPNITPELAADYYALVDALNDTVCAVLAAELGQPVQAYPGHEVSTALNLYAGQATTLSAFVDDDDRLDALGQLDHWNDELDTQANTLARAMITHEATCTDHDDCPCHDAVGTPTLPG